MPYRVTVEKYMSALAEYWTNVYWVNAMDMATAELAADQIVTAEKPTIFPSVSITKYRIDDGQPDTDVYFTKPINQVGTLAAASTILPLWCVCRVDFGAANGGRPSRKYLRGGLEEGNVAGMLIASAMLTTLANYGLAIVGANVCDPQGFDLTSAQPWTQIAMRQLRRGSKKKVIP